jgi:5'-nucleotidase/UDP-sugar diphosphatase
MLSKIMRLRSLLLLIVLIAVSCQTNKSEKTSDLAIVQPISAEVVSFNILQMNDVYEIAPIEGGQRGGLARVATIKNELIKINPNTISIMAGDFLSPSALGVTTINGETLAGKQMVDSLNVTGLDYAILGNHEFDISEVPAAIYRCTISKQKMKFGISEVSRSLMENVIKLSSMTF